MIADRDNHRVQVIEQPRGEFVTKFDPKTATSNEECGDIHGVAVLSNGNVAAADLKNNRIIVFSLPMNSTDPNQNT